MRAIVLLPRRRFALLIVGTSCISGVARGDASVGGHVGVGLRVLTTDQSQSDQIWDDTARVRLATAGTVGIRLRRAVIGLHAGIATPLRVNYSYYYEGEIGASSTSTLYPFDVGLGAQIDIGSGFWLSAWLGATVTLSRSSSPATQINAIDYDGDIPAASWTDSSTSLGFGASAAYDIVANEHGRLAGFVAVESQGLGELPTRYNDGQLGSEPSKRSMSLTFGAAYHF